jgi:hypothetical protein
VADPVGAALVRGLLDQGRAERFARVDRHRQVGAGDRAERRQVLGRRMAVLRTGQVEGDDAVALEVNRDAGKVEVCS